MNLSRKLSILAALIGAAVCLTSASATINTQSTAPANFDSYWYGNGWNWGFLGTVSLAQGTDTILDLHGQATAFDQGWGGQDPDNGLKILLRNNTTNVDLIYAIGGLHDTYDTQYFNYGTAQLDQLNLDLANIDWTTNPDISLSLIATPWAFPGWELHVQGAEFEVTSHVPEASETIALFAMALAGMTLARRKLVRA